MLVKLLITFLIISTLILFVFYLVEIKPYLHNKIQRKYFMLKAHTNSDEFKNKVLYSAMKFSKHETPKMSLADNTFFPVVLLRKISLKLNKNNRLKNSFPRGYLLNGIFDYADTKNDINLINYLEKIVDSFLINLKKNDLKYIDQACMGMVLINLYKKTKRAKYKEACDSIAIWLLQRIDQKHGIILYRPNMNYQYVDTLGMICPFLVMYGSTFKKYDFISLSNHQIKYYIDHALNSNRIPFHAIELDDYSPMGSCNWGRGLGWYLLALSATLKYTNTKNNSMYKFFKNEIKLLKPNLDRCKKNQYWGQFLGVSKNWHVDTSVSCMVFYSLSLIGEETEFQNFYDFIKPLTTRKGEIDYTSGDTEDINIYSREYGKSELTQGILLSIFKNELK